MEHISLIKVHIILLLPSLNPLTPTVKPRVIQRFLTFDSTDRTLMCDHWKAVEQYFTLVVFVFQFYPVCNFGKVINFGLFVKARI